MRIAVPKEVFEDEQRVALVPGEVAKLIKAEHTVVVEAGAGEGSSYTDEEYKEYGQDLGSNQGLGYAGNSFGTPRTYGIDITYEY